MRGELGLVEEDAERRAVVAVGRDHRRGQDHDEADDDEHHGRAEQHVVGGDRRLEAREERQRAVQQARTLDTGTLDACRWTGPAIAARLALGEPLLEAVRGAKAYLTEAIRRSYSVGHGHGPVDHLHPLTRGSVRR